MLDNYRHVVYCTYHYTTVVVHGDNTSLRLHSYVLDIDFATNIDGNGTGFPQRAVPIYVKPICVYTF